MGCWCTQSSPASNTQGTAWGGMPRQAALRRGKWHRRLKAGAGLQGDNEEAQVSAGAGVSWVFPGLQHPLVLSHMGTCPGQGPTVKSAQAGTHRHCMRKQPRKSSWLETDTISSRPDSGSSFRLEPTAVLSAKPPEKIWLTSGDAPREMLPVNQGVT